MAEFQYPHIGNKIYEVLLTQRRTKAFVARTLGKKISRATNICDRRRMYADDLHKISLAMGHNFFQYYPLEGLDVEKNKAMDELRVRIAELEKENGYLKEINDLLRKTKP